MNYAGDWRRSVASHNGSPEAPQADAGLQSSIPAKPDVQSHELYRGIPNLLMIASGHHYSIGWQDDRKAGPSFVVARVSRLDAIKVIERFPLTEQGWASAWRKLSALDVTAASAIAPMLARREAGRRAAT